ncbi:hypothetical protein [Nannocystis sp. SCPEA4]|nr:hypothetical protein [Nannocystis sp. SCPEA4]MCY1058100.1 hypothetical protein [Nannocystis sp. SCPEA4]
MRHVVASSSAGFEAFAHLMGVMRKQAEGDIREETPADIAIHYR